jgi:hypothetical protein
MSRRRSSSRSRPRLLLTAARWPLGLAVTAWAYMWRTTPMHRRELPGTPERDAPPRLPDTAGDDVQRPPDGAGPLLHRRYEARIRGAGKGARELMAELSADPNRVAPGGLARFHKVEGEPWRMAVGDEFVVRMPGPWDGPVRVVEVTPTSFRLATLEGHLEAGQIEWRAEDGDDLVFAIESWARSGDRLSDLMHNRLRMAKEVQLHMWTTVLERVARRAGGKLPHGVDIETRRVAV